MSTNIGYIRSSIQTQVSSFICMYIYTFFKYVCMNVFMHAYLNRNDTHNPIQTTIVKVKRDTS